jgi:hypothetical protein
MALTELEKKTVARITDLIPKHTLTTLRLSALAALERHFEAAHLKVAATAASELPKRAGDALLDKAMQYVEEGNLRYGMVGFYRALHRLDNLPALLCECLKEAHPKMTPAAAGMLIPDDDFPQRTKIRNTCVELAGYEQPKKEPPQTPPTEPGAAPSTGTPSLSGFDANAASVGATPNA